MNQEQDDIAIRVENLSKCYQIYDTPRDRLKQFILPRVYHLTGQTPRQYFREFWALRDVSFEVKKGETIGIIGRNGSGKSTLLQLICGTLNPTSGSITTHGRIAALLELGSGFNPEFTGRENVFLNLALQGFCERRIQDKFDSIASFADIGEFIDQPVKTYSSGMFARLAFAAAIYTEPEVLIVDEILAVGDMAFQRKCLNKFYEIRESGCSILFVSHDQYQVKSICQRALYLEKGQQKMFGLAGHVIDEYMIDVEGKVSRMAAEDDQSQGEAVEIPDELKGTNRDALQNISGDVVELQLRESLQLPVVSEKECDELFRIISVAFTDDQGVPLEVVVTGQKVRLVFDFVSQVASPPDQISFVFNLYRHDDLYLCGATTLMDGLYPHQGSRKGRVIVEFPEFPLLSGQYKWRVGINDRIGFVTYAEVKGVCHFRVRDDFKAVGMINLPRRWFFELAQ